MTMPKKGLRKIVVDGQTYNYVVKRLFKSFFNNKRLTIELGKNKYYSEDLIKVDEVTPAMVEEKIRENL